MLQINIKKGDTFRRFATVTDESGNPIAGEVANIKSQIRTPQGLLIDNLAITETSVPGTYMFYADTSNWPREILHMDIKYDDGIIIHSETIGITVAKEVTRDG